MMTRTQVLAGMMLVLMASPLFAAPDFAAAEAERLLKQEIDRREQERREQRRQEAHTPGATTPAPPPVPAVPVSGPCFPIKDIRLTPAGVLPAARVRSILAPYRGRCLQASDLAALQSALNAEAMALGLVTTRVVVPEQNLASGTLDLEVWPGRVEALRAPSLSRAELALAAPARPGDLLQLRALEQAVDNLNRLASFHATLALLPGEKAGGSLVDFSVVRASPWQGGLSWQSDGLNGDAASNNVRASLTLDSPFKLADRLVLGANATLHDDKIDAAHGGSIDYDVALGWWRFSLGSDRFDYENQLSSGLTTFIASGKSRSWRYELARVLHRDARNRLNLALHGKQRLSDNFVDDIIIGVSTTRVIALGLRADYSRTQAPWVFDATLDVEGGEGHSPAAFSPLDSDYSRILGSTRVQYYFERASVTASVGGQWSDARLAPSEQMTLTTPVPGFSPLSLNANSALSAQVEAAYPVLLQRAGFTSLRPSVAMAWAMAPNATGNAAHEEIAALKAGLTAPWRSAVINAGIAFPLEKLSTLDALDPWQLDASVSVSW